MVLFSVAWMLIHVTSNVVIDGDTKMKADFVLSELQKLSETGIYSTLQIKDATLDGEHDGIFHHNTILSLKLHSPHFASNREVEEFRVVIMKHKSTNKTTFAIDEFPVMKEDAIEQFYIEMVKRKRIKQREQMEQLEIEHQDIFT